MQDEASAQTKIGQTKISAIEKGRPEGRRLPKKATPKRLRNAALFYIDRYAPAEAQLRRMLRARVARSARAHGADPDESRTLADAIDEMIQDFIQAGLLNDRRYAQAKAASLLRRGTSPKGIGAYLRARGIGATDIAAALEDLCATTPDPELAAAAVYARKRRIGPFRPKGEREARRDRDLAALGRRGFSFETARQVLEAEDSQALEALTRQPSL